MAQIFNLISKINLMKLQNFRENIKIKSRQFLYWKQLHWRRLFCATTSYPFPKGRNLVVSYLQTHIWLQSGFIESIEINPLEYLSARRWGRGANNTKDNWRKFTTSTNHAMQVCEMCSFRSNKKRCCQDCNCKTEMCQNPLKYVLCIYMFLLHYFRYL